MLKPNTLPITLGLAPMEGVTGLSTRLWLSLVGGVPAMTTPFLRATYSFPLGRLPPDYVTELDDPRPLRPYDLMPQIMAAAPEDFMRAASLLPQEQVLELNCGCPAPTSVGSGAGSALLRDPKSYHEFIKYLCDHLGPNRLAVKMRLGLWDADMEFPRLFEGLAQLPLARLTIHARTREERYLGKSHWSWIQWAARQTPIPVFASGDVLEESSLLQLQVIAPQVQGVLIGRGALRNPWIFGELLEGTPPDISLETMIVALKCFVQLERIAGLGFSAWPGHQLQRVKFRELCQLIWSLGPAGTSGYRWSHSLNEIVSWSAELTSLTSDKMEKVLLGRLKMLWNYLRSSVPEVLQDPSLLRVGSTQDFWEGLKIRMATRSLLCSDQPFRLTYQPQWDWVYGGGGKKGAADKIS